MKDYEQRERDLANIGHKDLIRFMRHAYNWLLDDGMSESELEASLAKFGLCKEDIFAKRQRMGVLAMIDKESETIESLVSLLLTFTPDQMVAFVAGAREIIAKYTPKN